MVRRHTDGKPYIGSVSALNSWTLHIEWLSDYEPDTIITFATDVALFLYLEDVNMDHVMSYRISRAATN